jgi:hypothetical protein
MRKPRQQQRGPLAASARHLPDACAARLRKRVDRIQDVGMMIVGERK